MEHKGIAAKPEGGPSKLGRWLLLSLALHGFLFVQFELIRLAAIQFPNRMPQWVRDLALSPEQWAKQQQELAKQRQDLTEEYNDPHLTFVEVDPASVTAEEPPKTPYYSTANTLAANPTPSEKPTTQPKFEGTQDQVVRTFSNDRPDPGAIVPPAPTPEASPNLTPVTPPAPTVAPTPTPEPPTPRKEVAKEKIEARPQGGPLPGDYTVAKAETQSKTPISQTARPGQAESPPPSAAPKNQRPKSLAEQRAKKGLLVGEKMKQDGGVARLKLQSSLDVKASPFGSYDAQMMFIIQQRWYALLEEGRFANDGTGKVVVRFKLKSDGSISDLATTERTVTERLAFICESAVIDPAHYTPWPTELKVINGSDTREITFTFYYN